nr:hypothetical protein [Tanacetum cinerariifolium]
MIIELDYPLLETNEAILFSKLTIDVCGSKQEEALKWEPHDKTTKRNKEEKMVEISSLTKTGRFKSLRQAVPYFHAHFGLKIEYTLLEDGSRFHKLYVRNMVMWEVKPRKEQRHMIIELDNPLLETNEAILFLKLTIGMYGSKQEEALKWEPHDKVVADTDDHHIVIKAPHYQIMSFMIGYTLLENGSRFPTNGILTSRVMCEVEPRERQSHMIIEQEEALKWEPHDKVVVDTDDHHIVREAPRYQIISFKV